MTRTSENTSNGWRPKQGETVLVAIGGDCGPGGHCHWGEMVKIDATSSVERGLVEDLLRAQLELDFHFNLIKPWTPEDKDYHSRERHGTRFTDTMWRRDAAASALYDYGVFEHKWHCRSTWILKEWCYDDSTPTHYLCWIDGKQFDRAFEDHKYAGKVPA
tara:strand:+ start:398 stop:877 length:480 start_codon:yes stop_codon:yes gene_type:complete